MRILISGVDGNVGREIVNQLTKKKKYKLFLFTNKKNKKIENFKIFYQNLTKPINLKLKLYAVIHCAAKHRFSKKGNNMRNIYSSNIKMTKNLIKFCNKNNVKKLIFLSSVDVYGQIKNKVLFEDHKPLKPDMYGKSKFISEKLLCNKNNKFKAICLRIPGIFTFNLKNNYPLIIKIVKLIMDNKDVYTYNLNKKFNNILDVKEIVKFIMIALNKKKIKSNIYNFSASNPIQFIYLIRLLKKILKSKSKIIDTKPKKTSFVISIKKISRDFNFKISSTKNIVTRCCRQILSKGYIAV